MKLTTIILIVFSLNISATVYSQNTKLSLSIQNQSIKEILFQIEKQSEFRFIYESGKLDLSKQLSFQVNGQTVENILTLLFEKEKVEYEITENNLILIRPASMKTADSPVGVAQQNKQITGTVVDPFGTPIIGASVMQKGTTNGTITDIDGNFKLNVNLDNVEIQVSYIGYKTQTFIARPGKSVNITMTEDSELIDEVVVVGYGVQKKSDVTGATLRVNEEALKARPVNNVLQALQGKAAGVDITSSERPGTMGSVNIRGVRSLKASNAPLYVVDGIPLMTDGIDYLNTNDIESIDILKDASATAIYGSRGANGVIIITTKQGKTGKINMNYSGSVTAETLQDEIEMMNSAEYIEWRRWSYYYSNPANYPRGDQPTQENDYKIFNGSSDPYAWANIEKGWQSVTWDGSKVANTDWIGMVKQTGITQQHTLSGSGGTDKMKGYFSFGYLDNEGTSRGQEYTRYTAKTSFDVNPVDWFSIGGNISASYGIQEYGQSKTGANLSSTWPEDIYYSARSGLPYAVPYDDEGNRIRYPGGDQAISTIVDEWNYSQDQRTNLRILGSFYAQLDLGKAIPILDGLRYRLNFGPDFSNYRQGVYIDGESVIRNGSNYAYLDKKQTLSYTLDQLVYYNKSVKKHNLGLTLLQSMTKYKKEGSSMSANDIPYPSQKWNALNNSNVSQLLTWDSSLSEKQLLSYMVRLNYGFADKYLMTLSGRWDGASQLAEGNKWSFFPSMALGWRIDQEDFMSDIDFISQLKLRAGVGVTGNAAIDPYVTKGSVNSLFYPYGSSLIAGTAPSTTMANQNLSWERTLQYNIGLDFSFWQGRLSGGIDVYKSKTSDLLMQMSIPSITSYTSTYANVGETENKGIDISLNSTNIDKAGFQWTTDFSASWTKDKIVSLSNGKEDDINNTWFIGKSIGVIYGYESNGLWKEEDVEEMQKFNDKGHNFKVGMSRPVDQNNDHKIDANNDRVVIGNTRPNWTLGMTNTFSYKGLELSVFLFGRLGYYYNTGGEAQTGRFSQRKLDYYNENNQNAEYQIPIYTTGTGDPYFECIGYQKASFIKIRNISLGYVLPKKVLEPLKVSNIKLYFQITNPGMLYSSIDFLDLDVSRSTWNRGYTFGVNIDF